MRRVNDILDEKNLIKDSLSNSRRLIFFSSIFELILSILFFLFVLNKGNILDYTISLIVLLFFYVVIVFHFISIYINTKKYKKLEREFNLATETKEQKIVRERSEKFTRILKKEE